MYDLLIKNLQVVQASQDRVETLDVAIKDGRFAALAQGIDSEKAKRTVDGSGLTAFPGVVDAHMHVGIYSPLEQDAQTESKAAAMGGVTTALTYFRTGQYYLNEGGPYREFYPKVLETSSDRYWVDYAYHLAPIAGSHIDEMEWLLTEQGVSSFKIFMFYGGYGLHGKSDKDAQRQFLMLDEDDSYDIAHFEFIMRSASRLMKKYPNMADQISVSLHCELADILNAYTRIVQKEGKLSGLRAYSAARPPHSEGLAIWIASYLAYETECLNINLLHLTSRKALEAAMMMEKTFPHISFGKEVTIGHLMMDYDVPTKCHAKVNPPIRSREDVEFLWRHVLDGTVDWVVSDHACCSEELKVSGQENRDENIWVSKSGFGGTEYLLSALHSEGTRRGLSLPHIARLVSLGPARRYGLNNKGDIAVGLDADLALMDAGRSYTVRSEESESGQGYTPFEGMELTGQIVSTYLRGHLVYENGKIKGPPLGQYQWRPSPEGKAHNH